jgi:xyloglucan-specific endo-beta-1,4-glucanase
MVKKSFLWIALSTLSFGCASQPDTLVAVESQGTEEAVTGASKIEYFSHGQYFTWNGIVVLNNQWGRDYATNSDKYQVIRLTDDNKVQFDYKWAGNTSYVKGYPTFVVGWHFGNPGGWMTPQGSFGLPARISDNKAFYASISGTHYNNGTYTEIMNLSWDIWLANSSNPSGPNGEIMVWPWRQNQQPIGSLQATATIWGATWDVYRGTMSAGGYSWTVVSYIRRSGTLSIGENLRDFINDARNRGWFSSSMYIVGIECGNEIIQGHGRFEYTSYTIRP